MTVIEFDDVSKKYKLYSRGGLYLRDRMTHFLHRVNPFNGRRSASSPSSLSSQQPSTPSPMPSVPSPLPSAPTPLHPLERDFWALRNVSFKIEQGESVGIIGRNGAGKSTVLKLLAGVTKPSFGTALTEGRIAPLIEVGAGFHPELTGRENVYLNGSILGMKKAEMDQVFDSIVSFAELEEFIDTPVKHYSSGMYVRLGFAIAAHTNPDIYLIDEVLAVGDEAFQKKCLDTLAAHKAAGKTMILVSHDLVNIEEVCKRCIYLNHGEVRYDGTPVEAIKRYRADLDGRRKSYTGLQSPESSATIVDVIFRDDQGVEKSTFKTGENVLIEIRYCVQGIITNPVIGLAFHEPHGQPLAGFNTRTHSLLLGDIKGTGSIFCRLNAPVLTKGKYGVSVALQDYEYEITYAYEDQRYFLNFDCSMAHLDGFIRLDHDWAWDVRFVSRCRDASAAERVETPERNKMSEIC